MVSYQERATTTISSYWTWWWEATSKKDLVNQAVLTILIAIFAILRYLWASLRARKRTAPLPPGPRGLPIVGYLPFLGSNTCIIHLQNWLISMVQSSSSGLETGCV